MKNISLNIILFSIIISSFISCNKVTEYDASGNFEAVEVTLSAESSGKILQFDVEEGDYVCIGQIVAQIDTTQLYHQRQQLLHQYAASDVSRPNIALQLASLNQELEKQKYERKRIENLLADGAATAKQLDDINAAIKVLEDRIAAQKSTMHHNIASINESSSAIAVGIEELSEMISNCQIITPINGVVLTKYCQAGEYVLPGKPLLKVADLNQIYLRAYISSSQLANVKLSQKVTVIANYGGDRLYEYPGIITWISSESEFTPKNIQTQDSRSNLVYAVKIAVKNDGFLKIGGYGNVKL